jgi:3D (Asp-Asp-Asp) domain-containing protein
MKHLTFVAIILAVILTPSVAEVATYKIEEPTYIDLGEYIVTAYCPCEKCCGKWAKNRPNGIVYGAYGIELVEGVSVAAPFPEGTVLVIEGREYIVHDKTAEWIVRRYNGKIVDIYFGSHQKALEFGKKALEVRMQNEKN